MWQKIRCFFGYHTIIALDAIIAMDSEEYSCRCIECGKLHRVK